MMKRRRKVTSRRHGMQVVTLCISTTMVLILLGLVVLSVLTARNLSTSLKENMSVSLVLGDTVSLADGQALMAQLKARPYARQVKYISQEEALRIMTKEMGDDPVKFAGVNPFQAEIEMLLQANYANSDSLRRTIDVLQQDPRIVEVMYAKDQIDAVDRNVNRINIFLLVLLGLNIFICFTLVSNSVQLGVYSRRFTIHTQKLVGARWSLIRRPFLAKSIGIGLVASLLACAVLGAAVYSAYQLQPGASDLITPRELIITAVAIVVFGFVIMLLCTLLSVNKFLRMTAGELYNI